MSIGSTGDGNIRNYGGPTLNKIIYTKTEEGTAVDTSKRFTTYCNNLTNTATKVNKELNKNWGGPGLCGKVARSIGRIIGVIGHSNSLYRNELRAVSKEMAKTLITIDHSIAEMKDALDKMGQSIRDPKGASVALQQQGFPEERKKLTDEIKKLENLKLNIDNTMSSINIRIGNEDQSRRSEKLTATEMKKYKTDSYDDYDAKTKVFNAKIKKQKREASGIATTGGGKRAVLDQSFVSFLMECNIKQVGYKKGMLFGYNRQENADKMRHIEHKEKKPAKNESV